MSRRPDTVRGHTLIEFVIAMALGLIVTAGVIALYRSQRAAFDHAGDAMRIREAGLTSLMLIGQQLQMAGFVPADVVGYTAPAGVFGCSGGRPTGTDDSPGCEALVGRSDGVVVRYVGDVISTWPSASGQATDCLGQVIAASNAALGVQGVPVVNRFFARASGSTGEPELYCEGNGKAGSAQPLVEGVERVRLKYWVSGAGGAVEASAVPNDRWAKVVAVDLCVLVRGAPAGQRSRYVDCDGVSGLGADYRARQAFSRRVAIRNQTEATL